MGRYHMYSLFSSDCRYASILLNPISRSISVEYRSLIVPQHGRLHAPANH